MPDTKVLELSTPETCAIVGNHVLSQVYQTLRTIVSFLQSQQLK